MRKITLSLLGFFTFFIGQAQNSTSKNKVDTNLIKSLDEVVVTGQYKPQSARNSVYQVRVISAARIRQQGATQLQDVLKNELSIRFSQDLATGG